ncbi:MAG: hypothetical protein GX579_20050 [Chloroflexi bacterium]|jgi:tetratricopeptide (TPR) repeat protein|nr:hypothetical protein [Chloroflexota bacterium]
MRRLILLALALLVLLPLLAIGYTYIQGGADLVERRVSAVPAYARSYLRRFRPTPVLPTPPPVSAAQRDALLSARLPTVIPSAAPPSPQPSATPLPPLPTLMVLTPAPSATPSATPTASATPTPTLTPYPATPMAESAEVEGIQYHAQMWNNCGPATLTMNLSFFGIYQHQREAASYLKPNGDDKNVSPEQMLAYAAQKGLEGVVRMGGDMDLLRRFLSNGIPVIVETWIKPEDHGGMGHYRLITSFDGGTFIAQDSYFGPDRLLYAAELDLGWRVFNRKFIVLFEPEDEELVMALLGPLADESTMLELALERAQEEAAEDPDDAFAWFNLGTVYTRLGETELAVGAFDEARRIGLPLRMLWYQFEPFEAYLDAGRYDDVVQLGYATAYSASGHEEAYFYEGLGYLGKGMEDMAVSRWQQALEYNPNFEPATGALEALAAGS